MQWKGGRKLKIFYLRLKFKTFFGNETGLQVAMFYVCIVSLRRSQWPRGLRRGSAVVRLLGL
jgi:hypothetical protein